MDHWHCQRCGAEQVTAPLSAAGTKLAKSRHKLASQIFSNVTLFFIYFFLIHFSGFHHGAEAPPPHRRPTTTKPLPLVCILEPNPFTSEAGGEEKKGNRSESTKQEQQKKKGGLPSPLFTPLLIVNFRSSFTH